MSAASNFYASYSQSVTQTTSFIGSASVSSGHDEEGATGFTEALVPLLWVPVIPVDGASGQLTSISTTAGAYSSSSSSSGQSTSPDSMVQLLEGLESEIAKLSGELSGQSASGSSQGSSASCGSEASGNGLQGDYATLYNDAVSAVQDGSAFKVTLPSGETLSGKFSYSELEVAGDNSLFTPGDPSAPDAGKTAFENSLEQFLELSQDDSGSGSANGQIANYTTNTSFSGDNSALSWSGSFSLAPANAIPKNS